MQIRGKTFVVTGGGAGIGREVVLELLRRGAHVAAVDISEAGLARTASLPGVGERLSTHVVDLAHLAEVEALPGAVHRAHRQVDGVLNVAGIVHRFVPLTDMSFDEIRRVMDVNFWGTVHINKVFLQELISRPEAALVNVSSLAAFIPVPGQSAYSASKAAVKLWTEGLQGELAHTNVVTTTVFPGAVATDIAQHSGADSTRVSSSGGAMKATRPEDAARQIVTAVAKGRPRVRIGTDSKVLDLLSRLIPTRSIHLIAEKTAAIDAAGETGD